MSWLLCFTFYILTADMTENRHCIPYECSPHQSSEHGIVLTLHFNTSPLVRIILLKRFQQGVNYEQSAIVSDTALGGWQEETLNSN